MESTSPMILWFIGVVVMMALIILALFVLKMQSCALQELFPELVPFFSGGMSVLPL